ncbi:MAG: tyrosine-protein phosphatase [Victivallales bacterium]|nr:tyrosine-protein phosphatase [Victivallales bacterium]
MTKLVILHSPADGEELSLLPTRQRAFLDDESRKIPHEASPAVNAVDGTQPPSLMFVWKGGVDDAMLQLSLTDDFATVERLEPSVPINEYYVATVSSLLPGERYFWRIVAPYGTPLSATRSFAVKYELPRWILAPKVTNVRDCGGWRAGEGARVRFGMLYRGAQFEPWTWAEHRSPLTADGERMLFDVLGIRTELDLRGGGKPVLERPGLRWVNIPVSAYCWSDNGIFTPEQMANYARIFQLLSDADAYPIYFHCQGGGDRTGTLAFILGAALGVSEEDLLMDYELSTLSLSGERTRFSTVWRGFRDRLGRDYPGSTLQGQAISYLHACGVPDGTLEKVRSILLKLPHKE